MTFQSGQTISVKAVKVDTNDVRRFALPVDSSLATLQQKLEVFDGAPKGGFKVFWQDDQNDKVTLATDDDLRYAVEETMPALLRLAVRTYEGPAEEEWQIEPESEHLEKPSEAELEAELPEELGEAELEAEHPADVDINGGEDEDVAIKLVQATHRVRANDASARSERYMLGDEHKNLCYVEGTHGWAEFTMVGSETSKRRGLAELLIKYASAEPRPLRLLVDGELRGTVCVHETQGFGHAELEWRTHTPIELDLDATHVVRLETDGFFPHLMELALVPTERAELDDEFNLAQAAKGSARAVVGAIGSMVSGFVDGMDGLMHAVVEAVDPSMAESDEDEHERWATQQQAKRERRRDARAAARREAEQRLALARRWSKFLPHANDGALPVLIDGSAIADDIRSRRDSDRQAQMRVLDHVQSAVPITKLSFRVVFEGAPGKWAKKFAADNLELIFTHDRPSVDELCKQAADSSLVVTCDREVALAVLEVGAKVMKANRFHTLTDTDSEDSSESDSDSESGSSSEESESEEEQPRHSRGGRHNR